MVDEEVNRRVEQLKKKVAKLEKELAQAKYDLAHAYEDRYPNGRFIICRGNSPVWNGHGGAWFELYFQGIKNFGFSNKSKGYGDDKPIVPGVYKSGYRCSIFRKTTQYDTIEKLMKAAKKFNVPLPLLEHYVKYYEEIVENSIQ